MKPCGGQYAGDATVHDTYFGSTCESRLFPASPPFAASVLLASCSCACLGLFLAGEKSTFGAHAASGLAKKPLPVKVVALLGGEKCPGDPCCFFCFHVFHRYRGYTTTIPVKDLICHPGHAEFVKGLWWVGLWSVKEKPVPPGSPGRRD